MPCAQPFATDGPEDYSDLDDDIRCSWCSVRSGSASQRMSCANGPTLFACRKCYHKGVFMCQRPRCSVDSTVFVTYEGPRMNALNWTSLAYSSCEWLIKVYHKQCLAVCGNCEWADFPGPDQMVNRCCEQAPRRCSLFSGIHECHECVTRCNACVSVCDYDGCAMPMPSASSSTRHVICHERTNVKRRGEFAQPNNKR